MPEHYDPETAPRWRRLTGLAAWIAVACAAVALDWARRQLAAPRATWRPLALAALAVALASAVTHAPLSWGPSHADAATGGDGLVGAMGAGVEAPAVEPGATVDPLLQPGHYASPRDDATVGPPAAEAEAGPAGEPLPVWLPATVTRWEPNIRAATSRHSVDPALVSIVMTVESAGNPQAGSHAGAQGLMQVVPRWHPRILEGGGPFDPDHNLDVATAFLAELLRTYAVAGDEADGWQRTVERAAAAYNGGPGGVTNPVAETRSYVRWVGGMWRERRDDDSPTYRDWLAAGGQVAVDIAGTRPGPGGPPPDLPHLEASR